MHPTKIVSTGSLYNNLTLLEQNIVHTLKFLPGSLVISCLAMSSHCVTFVFPCDKFNMSWSDSQSRCEIHAYVPAGDASVNLVVVTMPVALPAHWAHCIMDVTRCSLGTVAGQSENCTLDVTPIVPLLFLTPQR